MATHTHKTTIDTPKAEHSPKRKGTPETKRPTFGVADPQNPTKAIQVEPQPVDVSEYKGSYWKKDQPKDSDFSHYGLKLVPDDQYGHTHHLANQEHHWSGTEAQFKDQFEK